MRCPLDEGPTILLLTFVFVAGGLLASAALAFFDIGHGIRKEKHEKD